MDTTVQNQGKQRQRMELGVLSKPEGCGAKGQRSQLINDAECARELADKQRKSERNPHSTDKVQKGWGLHRACEEEPI